MENKQFAWSDWDVWELKNTVYWNIKNHLREDDTNYRILNDIVENKLRSIKATIEIAGWE